MMIWHSFTHKTLRLALLCGALAASAGCNWLVPIIFVGEHKRTVPAEFQKLSAKRALVLVWAEPATMFDYPHVRLELATYVSDKIGAGIKDARLIEPAHVEDYVQRKMDADIDALGTGEHFDVDYVVYVELLHFQIRDPSSPDLVQGRADATISVYDINASPDETNRYILSAVQAVYPESQPALMTSQNALLVRQQTYERFSEKVARKFFDHKVDL